MMGGIRKSGIRRAVRATLAGSLLLGGMVAASAIEGVTPAGASAVINTFTPSQSPADITSDGTHFWYDSPSLSGSVTEANESGGSQVGAFGVGAIPYDMVADGTHLWVANAGSDTVSELNQSDGSLVRSISTGNAPVGVSADGTDVWVADSSSNAVTEIDQSTGSVVGTFTTGIGNTPTSITSDGTHVWVANISDGTVTELNASDGSYVRTIGLAGGSGAYPYSITSDTHHVWVADFGSDAVTEIDSSTGSVVATITVGSEPRGISDDGTHVWVANYADGSVSKIDTSDGSVAQTITVGGHPESVHSDGTDVMVANPGLYAVQEINAVDPVALYAAPVASGTGDCSTPANACDSVQSAITTATVGSYTGDDVTVNVAAGTYTENDTVDASSLHSLTIAGADASTTTLNGNGAGSDITVNGGSVTVSALTMENGQAGDGGGIANNNATLTVADSVLDNNTASDDGGAINNNSGTLHVADSTFTDNTATGNNGGAIDSCDGVPASPCHVTVTGSTFTGNHGSSGGAIMSIAGGSATGSLSISTSTFADNTADRDGGAVDSADYQGTATLTVSGSTFSDNTAGENGGAIDNADGHLFSGGSQGTANIADSTFSANGAPSGDGGTIDNGDTTTLAGGYGNMTITSSTISNGSAGGHGGNIDSGDNGGTANLTMAATIVANGASGGDCAGTVTDEGYNIDNDGSCGLTGPGSISHSSTLDTTLGALRQNAGPTETILPYSDSPVVGAIPNNTTLGVSEVCPTTDQQGVATGPGARCAMGATQTSVAAPTVSAVTFSGTAAAPTVTVWGSGFGTRADLGTATPAGCSASGSDYATTLSFADTTASWSAGIAPGECIGLIVSSYSDNQITFTFGSGLNSLGSLTSGDGVSVTVLGTTRTGTASFGSHAQGPPPYAYVANYGDGTVTPISTGTETADTPVTVGTHPDAIAISPNGSTAYVANSGSGTVTPIATATNAAGTPITVGTFPEAIAITPNGQTAFVANHGNGTVTPVTTATRTAGTPVSVGTGPDAIAISPDGQTAYVVNGDDDDVVPVSTATDTVGAPVAVGSYPDAIAITPNGQTAYVANSLDGTVTPIDLGTQTAGTAITVGSNPSAIAITPDGTTAYVTSSGNAVTPIDLATQTAEPTITVGSDSSGAAVSPDGTTAFVANYGSNSVTPITTSTGAPGAPITVGSGPRAVAVMPDNGPTASLAASTTGSTTTFNATASVPGSSPIVSYAWDFGDGHTATTSSATTAHTYATGICAGTISSPACTATVTVTDAVGASTTRVFTGQTVSLNGSSLATASTNVVIAVASCSTDNTCQAAVAAPSTPTAPAQTVTVTVPSGGSATGTLTVTTGSDQLACSSKGFRVVASNVTSFSSTFVPSTDVNVTDLIAGPTSTRGIKICFEGATPPPAYLKKCAAHDPVAPCATLNLVAGGVEATILVPGNDPKFKVDGVQTITENPTSITSKGVIGKTVTIKGTDLLGANGQSKPQVAFTSLGGSTIAGPVTKATATALTVEVPNGAATGAVVIAWPDETLITSGSVTIK